MQRKKQRFNQNLGKIGGTYVTYKIKYIRTDKFLCKKVIKHRHDQNAFNDARNAISEFENLSKIDHPCICKAIGINIS